MQKKIRLFILGLGDERKRINLIFVYLSFLFLSRVHASGGPFGRMYRWIMGTLGLPLGPFDGIFLCAGKNTVSCGTFYHPGTFCHPARFVTPSRFVTLVTAWFDRVTLVTKCVKFDVLPKQ